MQWIVSLISSPLGLVPVCSQIWELDRTSAILMEEMYSWMSSPSTLILLCIPSSSSRLWDVLTVNEPPWWRMLAALGFRLLQAPIKSCMDSSTGDLRPSEKDLDQGQHVQTSHLCIKDTSHQMVTETHWRFCSSYNQRETSNQCDRMTAWGQQCSVFGEMGQFPPTHDGRQTVRASWCDRAV